MIYGSLISDPSCIHQWVRVSMSGSSMQFHLTVNCTVRSPSPSITNAEDMYPDRDQER